MKPRGEFPDPSLQRLLLPGALEEEEGQASKGSLHLQGSDRFSLVKL